MSILFMMPDWPSASEGWMQQMMLNIADHITAIAVNDSTGEKSWKGKIPVYSLRQPEKSIKYFTRLLKLGGLSLKKSASLPEHELHSVLQHSSIQQVFCQYGQFAASFMNVWRATDIPLFVHFHGYDLTFDLRRSENPNKKRFNDEYLENIKELSQRAIFIANSKFTMNRLVESGISPDRIKLKYFGIPLPAEGHVHRSSTGVQILHLGRLVDFKSPDRTIRAFEIARSKGMDGQLIMAGDGPLRSMCELLRLRSPDKDAIHILGNVSSEYAGKLFSESDIFTAHNIEGELTRQSECFGVSILEAMAHGLPVVGTRHGGVLESVIDGKTGILNEPGDVEAQAEAFLELARNPELRQKMGEAGRKWVKNYFNPEQERSALKRIIDFS